MIRKGKFAIARSTCRLLFNSKWLKNSINSLWMECILSNFLIPIIIKSWRRKFYESARQNWLRCRTIFGYWIFFFYNFFVNFKNIKFVFHFIILKSYIKRTFKNYEKKNVIKLFCSNLFPLFFNMNIIIL